MPRTITNTPEGTRDLLYADCRGRRRVQGKITDVFKRRGYSEISTPAVEYYDVFTQSGSAIPQESLLKLVDRNGRITVMRPDCTTPIGRVAATKLRDEPLPQRLFYNETIFRSTAAHIGRSSEIAQCGIELIGAKGIRGDVEAVVIAVESMENCGAERFRIELGHAGFFKALARELMADADTLENVRTLTEQKSFAALNDLLSAYRDRPSYAALSRLSRLFGGVEVIGEARSLTKNEEALAALDYLSAVYARLENAGYGEKIGFDLGMVHQIDYYTGLVFQGYIEGTGHVVLSGGRYDGLLASFGRPAPATGFAIDVDGVALSLPKSELPRPKCMIHYDMDRLSEALTLQQTFERGECELSCCDTEYESAALAKEKKIKTLIVLSGNEKREVSL